MDLIGASSNAGYTVGWLILAVVLISETWIVFKKAGRPGWAAIIPIYNLYVTIKIARRPGWWLLLYIVPIVNIIVAVIVTIDVAKGFRKGTGFGVLMFIFPFIFWGILAFGSSTYDELGAADMTPSAS